MLRCLRYRGLSAPLLAGALGLWAALAAVFAVRVIKVLEPPCAERAGKLPKALNSEARRQLREMSYAPTRVECERLRDEYVSDLRADGRSDAADTVLRDWESFVSFYDFPVEHWVHLRTSLGVPVQEVEDRRHSTDEEARQRIVPCSLRLSERWRPLNGGRNLMGLLVDGAKFEDGILTERRGGRP